MKTGKRSNSDNKYFGVFLPHSGKCYDLPVFRLLQYSLTMTMSKTAYLVIHENNNVTKIMKKCQQFKLV